MKTAKAAACMMIVKLMFTRVPYARQFEWRGPGSLNDGEQWIAEREQHRDAEADDEGCVDQSKQQEHLALQLWHQLRLPRGSLEESRAHDAHADAGAQRAESDHQPDADARRCLDLGQELHLVHVLPFLCGSEVALNEWVETGGSMVLMRHRDVDDGQHHEDVGLQRHDQQVEKGPAEMKDPAPERADDSGRSPHSEQ